MDAMAVAAVAGGDGGIVGEGRVEEGAVGVEDRAHLEDLGRVELGVALEVDALGVLDHPGLHASPPIELKHALHHTVRVTVVLRVRPPLALVVDGIIQLRLSHRATMPTFNRRRRPHHLLNTWWRLVLLGMKHEQLARQ